MAIAVLAGSTTRAETTLFDGSLSTDWNTSGNWTNDIPGTPDGETIDAVVSNGLTAVADSSSTPSYVGSLTLEDDAGVDLLGTVADYNALGSGTITLSSNSTITIHSDVAVTVTNDINFAGNASIVNSGNSTDNEVRYLTGIIIGSGQFSYSMRRGNILYLAGGSANTWSGGIVVDCSDFGNLGSLPRVWAQKDGAFGTGNVTLNDGVSLVFDSGLTDTIDNGASLYVNGRKGNDAAKINLGGSSETVDKLFIDGYQVYAGAYTSGSGLLDGYGLPLIADSGTLTVLSSPTDATPPTVISIENPFGVGPIGEDITSVPYTVTFDDDIDATSVSAADFTNVGTATATIGTVTKTTTAPFPAVFTVEVLPTTTGTLILEIPTGTTITNVAGLAFVPPVTDDETIQINAGSTPPTIMIATAAGPGGSADSWNNAANWDTGLIPISGLAAIVSNGVSAQVNTTAPVYTGSLTLSSNASLRVAVSGENALGTGNITLNSGSVLSIGLGNYTFLQTFTVASNATIWGGYSTTAHNTERHFNAEISGPGLLTLDGVNGNKFHMNTNNTVAGLLAKSTQNQGFRIEANAVGCMGAGDVTLENLASLQIDSTNTIADSAALYVNGVKGPISKLVLNANETVDKFFIDGVQKIAGDYDSTSGLVDSGANALISGSGTLTVLASPPAIPPTIAGSNFVDNVYGGPIYEDHPYYPIEYTLTFDLDMDDTTVTSDDFENAGSSTIVFGTVTEPFDGVFTVPITTASVGTVILQIKAGADLQSSVGAPLDTTSAIADDTTITVEAGNAPATTIAGTAAGPGGSDDNWNNADNWDNGIPFGAADAIVGNGVTAQVDTTPRAYTGNLVLLTNATLSFASSTGKTALPTTPRILTMHEGSKVLTLGGGFGAGNLTFGPIVLNGDGIFDASGSDNAAFTFAGPISGDGGLSIIARNNIQGIFQASNTFSGGIIVSNEDVYIKAESDGAFGAGNVTVDDAVSIWIASGLSDAIDDDAVLSLNNSAKTDWTEKMRLDSDEVVGLFQIDGLPQQDGTWGAEGGSATYQTNLFSGTGVLTVRWTEIPAAGTVLIIR